MSILRPVFASSFAVLFACTVLFASGACTSPSDAEPPLDASPAPLDPAGAFAVTSAFSLAAPPPEAAAAVDELLAMIDGPDDPSRYLIDLLVARLPEGQIRSYAEAVAPYAAAYLRVRIDEVAPQFVDGARALGAGLSRIAHRFGARETLAIEPVGAALGTATDVGRRWFSMSRTITGLRFELAPGAKTVDVDLASGGLADLVAVSRAELEQPLDVAGDDASERFVIEHHVLALPYAAVLRLGFDRAVIPSVVPTARDLADALVVLVDCAHLGAVVSEWIGLGSPSLYAQACELGLTSVAARIYARLDAVDAGDVSLGLRGAALAVDHDGNASMDALVGGAWTGTLGEVAVRGTFAGIRR